MKKRLLTLLRICFGVMALIHSSLIMFCFFYPTVFPARITTLYSGTIGVMVLLALIVAEGRANYKNKKGWDRR